MRNLKRQFDCYDSLPAALRQALAEAAFDWDATMIAEALDVGIPSEVLLTRVRDDEKRRLPIDNYVMYGPEHPGSAMNVKPEALQYYRYPIARYYWWAHLPRPTRSR